MPLPTLPQSPTSHPPSAAVPPRALSKAPEALHAWAADAGVTETLRQFQQLATDVFPQGTEFGFALESDPDAGEDSTVCVATLPHGHTGEPLGYYRRFVSEWVRIADPRSSALFTLLVR